MNLDAYIQQWAADGGEYDLRFQQALDGDTTAAAEIWSSIASGEIDAAEAMLWARYVAQQVQADVIDADLDSTERPRAALAAIGFRGQVDRHAAAKRRLDILVEFDPDIGNGELVAALKADGHLLGMSHKTALNRVAEWRRAIT